MNKDKLLKHLKAYQAWGDKHKDLVKQDWEERIYMVEVMQDYTKEKLEEISADEIVELLSSLWSMGMWGNKRAHIEKLIEENGLDLLRKQLANLLHGAKPIEKRWDEFRTTVKGLGVATISELLSKMYPDKYTLWNGKAKKGFNALEVQNVPQIDGAIDGKRYVYLNSQAIEMVKIAKDAGFEMIENLLELDYFIWQELQNVSEEPEIKPEQEIKSKKENDFVHNDIRDKIKEIGQWLGFSADVERTVADGARVDTVWEVSIGNMGKVSYVFEVQTHGNIDSLILNLQRAKNNKTVQGIVAVSDSTQLEKIRKEVSSLPGIKDNIKYWDYTDVIKVYESLQYVNETINKIGLVPEGL